MSEMSPPPTRPGFLGGLPPLAIQALVWFGIILVGALIGWISRGALAGPEDVPTMTVYQDWRLTCPSTKEKDATCRLSQDVVDSQSGQSIASLVYFKDVPKDKTKESSMVLAVTVPLGVLLEPGVGMKLGADDMKVYQYKTCTQSGCIAVIPVNDDMLKTIKNAQVAELAVVGRDGKAVPLPFSIKGFTDAYDSYSNSEARHSSWWWRLWS
jgi:invasion protein IalB